MGKENRYIPPELLDFLKVSYGYSLLIKGEGGVGKTTLALELLVRSNMKSTLLTTRVSPAQVNKQFPWLMDEVKENIAILDATQTGTTIDNPMDEKQVAWRFSDMPEFLRRIMHEVEGNKDEAGLFYIIDSWDAIQLLFEHDQAMKGNIKPHFKENLNFLYNVFMSYVRQYNIKVILIAEDVSSMDFLVDSIVELKRNFLPNGKMVREIEMKKFRGIRVSNTSYIFSLEKGRFKAFMPWDLKYVNALGIKSLFLKYEEANLKLLFSSVFSSTSPVTIGTLVVEPGHHEITDLWIENLARYQLYLDNPFVIIPPGNFEFESFKAKMLEYLENKGKDKDRFNNNIYIVMVGSGTILNDDANVIGINLDKNGYLTPEILEGALSTVFNKISGSQGKKRSGLSMIYMDLPSMSNRFQNHETGPYPLFEHLNVITNKSSTFFIQSTYKEDPCLPGLLKISNVYMVIDFFRGTPLVNIISPQLPYLYGLLEMNKKEENATNFDVYPIV